ncbi:uncharacterized protein F4822DRAFT_428738 [Hypoxylon trugodes]|uniref:uncharacterized protein n=1 Tax=Hypoxylon trugodes TaxID=326681 RepID=UPI0021A12865|nr:uncharacterized protein F4822DRAFT_428738 [Hypoxylon trugodes]KAI1390400.1 hypothetical protein F4822DRAFT_428738 [Hypoxylon trugodes]
MRAEMQKAGVASSGSHYNRTQLFQTLWDLHHAGEWHNEYLSEWLQKVNGDPDFWGIPQGVAYTLSGVYQWLSTAGIIRLINQYPDFFIESKLNNPNVEADPTNPPLTIRNSGKLGTANEKRFEATSTSHPLKWLKSASQIREEATSWLLQAESVTDELAECGLTRPLSEEVWARYAPMSSQQKQEMEETHLDAIEDFRNQIYDESETSGRVKKLPAMTPDEQAALIKFLIKRYRNLELGHDIDDASVVEPNDLNLIDQANQANPDLFEDDDNIRKPEDGELQIASKEILQATCAEKRRFMSYLDDLLGGSDSQPLDWQKVEEITGWNCHDLRIDKSNP